jgi:hypothetical protein
LWAAPTGALKAEWLAVQRVVLKAVHWAVQKAARWVAGTVLNSAAGKADRLAGNWAAHWAEQKVDRLVACLVDATAPKSDVSLVEWSVARMAARMVSRWVV